MIISPSFNHGIQLAVSRLSDVSLEEKHASSRVSEEISTIFRTTLTSVNMNSKISDQMLTRAKDLSWYI